MAYDQSTSQRQERGVGGDRQQCPGEQHALVAEPAHERRGDRRGDHGVDPGDDQGQSGLQRRPAAQLLEVEHGDELEADERADEEHRPEVGPHQGPGTKDAEAHERSG